MTPEFVMTFGRQAMETLLTVAAPILLVALIVGLVVSLFQAVTQINEATLSFLPKLVAIVMAMMIAGPWMMSMLTEYLQRVLTSIPSVIG